MLTAAAAVIIAPSCRRGIVPGAGTRARSVGRTPRIRPDYSQLTLPPNLAPLNFVVKEPGTQFRIAVRGGNGRAIDLTSHTPRLSFPRREWRDLLAANRGGELRFEVQTLDREGTRRSFAPFRNTIAEEEIDEYLFYRVIQPVHNTWGPMGIYQRRLSDFQAAPILENSNFDSGCVNCHAFPNNEPSVMSLGVRSQIHGSSALIVADGRVTKLGAKFGYTAWHPSGRLVAYSVNHVNQFFHAGGAEVRDVVDLDSGLACFVLATQTAKTVPSLNAADRLETYPAWSPDGKYLYFCSAPILWSDRTEVPPERFDELRYDLRRVSYDLDHDAWGQPETVLGAEKTGLSILLPRISPDGRFLLFCMCDYGCFPIYQPSSDLYLMELESREFRRLEINSPRSESWHSWSSNSRWIAFSSKRRDGLFTRTYFSHVGRDGKVSKPFILPQEDPTFYDSYLRTFSVPELAKRPAQVAPRALARAVTSAAAVEVESPIKFSGTPRPRAWKPGR